MKKQILILAGSMMILASCGSNNTNQNTQAQMDSISKANAALQDEINKKKNDSTINAIATAKADSIEKAAKHEGGEHKGTGHKTGGKEPAPVATQTVAPQPTAQDNKFNNRQPGSQQSGTKLTPEQQQAQDDKFNRRGK